MKRTAYQITGQSFSEPTSLPDGFEVKTVEVDDPKAVTVGNIFDNKTLTVHPSNGKVNFIAETAGQHRCISLIVGQASALQVRDCLNAILEEDESSSAPSSPNGDSGLGDEELKVYREGDPKPEYSYTRRLLDSGQKRVGGNVYRRLWHGGDPLFHAEGRSGWSWSELLKDYGPLTEVTA